MSKNYLGTHDFSGASVLGVGGGAVANAYLSADQNITTSASTKVLFDTTLFDTASLFNVTTDRYEIATAGKYRIGTRLYLAASTAERYIVSIKVNGVSVSAFWFETNADQNIQFDDILDLSAGDYIEIFIDSESDSNYWIGGGTIDKNARFTLQEL